MEEEESAPMVGQLDTLFDGRDIFIDGRERGEERRGGESETESFTGEE